METFDIILPSPILSSFVKFYWILEMESTLPVSERIIPDGCMHLIFHRKKPMFSVEDNQFHPQSFIGGQTDNYSDILSNENISMVVVVFQPQGAKCFFRMPMNEFQKKNIPLDDLNDPQLKELEHRIQNTINIRECIEFIEHFLIKRLSNADLLNYERMNAAIQEINKESLVTMKDLSDVVCLSYKQFNRIFTNHIGINPKEFVRIVRFQRALFILQTQTDLNMTELAYLCGFYDQSHFIKEFKTFSGYTPTEYVAICNPHSDYFSNQ